MKTSEVTFKYFGMNNPKMASRNILLSTSPSRTKSKHQLWVDVVLPKSKPSSLNLGSRSSAVEGSATAAGRKFCKVKPTVTTLLRQHQIIEKNEEKEKERVEGFLLGNTAFDFERRKRQQELQTKKEVEALDAKRRLKAKLAYHKAIAATKNVVSQKSQQANHLRHQTKKLIEEHEVAQQAEIERRRSLAAEIHEDFNQSKRYAEEAQQKKRQKADELKREIFQLQEEARWKEQEDFKQRKEKIQRIQASKMAMRQSAGQNKLSPAAFIAQIGSPDAEIRMKVSKEVQENELVEKRKKVQAAKEERQKKLYEVQKKLEGVNKLNTTKRDIKAKLGHLPNFRNMFHNDSEIDELEKELKKFQVKEGGPELGSPIRWPYLRKH